jgi:hypothetical protein
MKVSSSNCQRFRAAPSALSRRGSALAASRSLRSSMMSRREIKKVYRRKSLKVVIQVAVSVRFPLRRAPLTQRNLSALKMRRGIAMRTTRVAKTKS